MADKPEKQASPGGSFLGGGPKFNQAGNNAPMPGEKVADVTTKQLPFGGPRVWLGVLVVLLLVAILFFFYGGDLGGVSHVGGGHQVAVQKPGLDPDHPDDSTQ